MSTVIFNSTVNNVGEVSQKKTISISLNSVEMTGLQYEFFKIGL